MSRNKKHKEAPMPWCPVCKDEFREGFDFCNNCKVPLVATREEAEKVFNEMQAEETQADTLLSGSEETEGEIAEDAPPVSEEEIYDKLIYGRQSSTYETKKTKFEDIKGSAYVFLVIGLGGTVYNVIRKASSFNRICMAITFALMIVYGIYALKKSMALKNEADAEEKKTDAIKNWMKDNLKKEEIEAASASEDEAENYFSRIKYIKDKIINSADADASGIDENYLDQLIDEFYNEMFSE